VITVVYLACSHNLPDCATDETLTTVDFQYMTEDFGYPFLVVHRKALQKCLVTGAMSSGVVKLHLNKIVSEYDFENTRFLVQDRKKVVPDDEANGITEPQWVHADVILAADGVKSKARGAMLQRKGEVDSGMSVTVEWNLC
jgi:salicylate hydroxylase